MCECGRLYKDRMDKHGNTMCSACYTGLGIEELKGLWGTPYQTHSMTEWQKYPENKPSCDGRYWAYLPNLVCKGGKVLPVMWIDETFGFGDYDCEISHIAKMQPPEPPHE